MFYLHLPYYMVMEQLDAYIQFRSHNQYPHLLQHIQPFHFEFYKDFDNYYSKAEKSVVYIVVNHFQIAKLKEILENYLNFFTLGVENLEY